MSQKIARVRVKELTQEGAILVYANEQVVAVFANATDAGEAYGFERLESARLRRTLSHVADSLSLIVGKGGIDGPVGSLVELIIKQIGRAIEHK